ncbi:hypothetical protein ACIGB8_27975 [Promicromonospora sukumoe]|uniref:hypothetical protein n=1 Tax=Promicromonospora sukumoe TaxID=88382 RepID=UPI0037CBADDC
MPDGESVTGVRLISALDAAYRAGCPPWPASTFAIFAPDAARPVVGRDPKMRFYPAITPGISVIPGAIAG